MPLSKRLVQQEAFSLIQQIKTNTILPDLSSGCILNAWTRTHETKEGWKAYQNSCSWTQVNAIKSFTNFVYILWLVSKSKICEYRISEHTAVLLLILFLDKCYPVQKRQATQNCTVTDFQFAPGSLNLDQSQTLSPNSRHKYSLLSKFFLKKGPEIFLCTFFFALCTCFIFSSISLSAIVRKLFHW